MFLINWLLRLCSGRPHFVIGNPNDPYLLRWYLFPRNHFVNLYLHKFLRSDDDRAAHDHPWWFVSFMIKGAYCERLQRGEAKSTNFRSAPSMVLRRTTDRHIVQLFQANDKPSPCWTIVLTGPKVREWGFWCPKGFVPWHEFVDHTDAGNVGRGCGE